MEETTRCAVEGVDCLHALPSLPTDSPPVPVLGYLSSPASRWQAQVTVFTLLHSLLELCKQLPRLFCRGTASSAASAASASSASATGGEELECTPRHGLFSALLPVGRDRPLSRSAEGGGSRASFADDRTLRPDQARNSEGTEPQEEL